MAGKSRPCTFRFEMKERGEGVRKKDLLLSMPMRIFVYYVIRVAVHTANCTEPAINWITPVERLRSIVSLGVQSPLAELLNGNEKAMRVFSFSVHISAADKVLKNVYNGAYLLRLLLNLCKAIAGVPLRWELHNSRFGQFFYVLLYSGIHFIFCKNFLWVNSCTCFLKKDNWIFWTCFGLISLFL